MAMNRPKRIIVGISGASGAMYAKRIIEQLAAGDVQVHLVVSPLGQRLLHDELGMEGVDLDTLSGGRTDAIELHNYRDVGASIASGSYETDGMVIAPCSSNSLAAVASGASQNLMHRAAQVVLKERRTLVLLHREMPISLVDIRNMKAAAEAGAVVSPANPGFYFLPKTIDDIVDFVAARVLDQLKMPHTLSARWGEGDHA